MPSIRRQPLPAPEPAEQLPPAPDWRTLGDLFDLGLELLRDGHFELIAPRLRAALRSIHFAWRDAVEIRPEGNNDATETLAIPRPVWDALLADVLADVRRVDAEMVAAGEVLPPGERPPLTDDEADEMGAFWFCVAAGEVTTPDPAQGPADERQPAGAEPG